MTIASFCREQLLANGPLSLDDLTLRAVDAGVTRARNPQASLQSVIRYREIELLDGRWVTGRWLLEGRCLTTTSLPYSARWYGEVDADLGLLGKDAPTADLEASAYVDDGTTVWCVRIDAGELHVTRIPAPDTQTLQVAAFAEQLAGMTPRNVHREQRAVALRAIAQLMVDDPSAFRTPLPPVSTWVPALLEDAQRRADEDRRAAEWHEADERRRARQVVLDDCTAIDVRLAAERAFMSVQEWVLATIDRALASERSRSSEPGGVVISLGDRWSWS